MAWTAVKEALKPIPSCIVLYLGWGCHLGKGVGGRRSLGKENSEAVWAKQPEFGMQGAVIKLLT